MKFNYHFTEREKQVMEKIVEFNFDVEKTAKSIGIKPCTTRSYIKCVGNKVGLKDKFHRVACSKNMFKEIYLKYMEFK